jgi:hypothetical protein
MPPPVTDQLEERRKRREARQRGRNGNGGSGLGQTPHAARDLLNGLITGGEDGHEQPPHEHALDLDSATASRDTRAREAQTASRAETVHDLVRRVQDSTAAGIGDASVTAPRRALSTVDLPPGATRRPRRTRPLINRVRVARARSAIAAKRPGRAVWTRTAAAAIAVLSVVAVSLLGTRGSPRQPHSSTSNAALTADQKTPLSGALRPTIEAIAVQLRALARAVPTAPAPRKLPRRHAAQHAHTASQRHTTAVSATAAVAAGAGAHTQSNPAVGPAPETQTSSSTPANTTSHTTAGSQTPATNSGQHAGPTNSNPLGGIGSCVSGCT